MDIIAEFLIGSESLFTNELRADWMKPSACLSELKILFDQQGPHDWFPVRTTEVSLPLITLYCVYFTRHNLENASSNKCSVEVFPPF